MGTGVLDQLGEAIDALADVDVDALPDCELDALVIGLARTGHRLAGIKAGALAHWDARGIWRSEGSRSAATRLAREGGTSLTTNDQLIGPEVLVPYLSDSDVETILFDGPMTVIAASNARTFAGRLRRAIQVRDRHCQHPSGCDIPADQCDVDHIVPVTELGETSQFNGRIQCRPHNRDATKHDHGATPHPPCAVAEWDILRVRLRRHVARHDTDTDAPAA